MKKKFIAMIGTAMMTLMISTTVLAVEPLSPDRFIGNYGYGAYSLMWNANGFVERDVFESNLEQAIQDGYIRSEYSDYFIGMYDYCIENGFGFQDMMGGRACCN